MNLENVRPAMLPLMLRRVRGEGMYPTLEKGQLVVILRASRFKIGDIVVFLHGSSEKIKRVWGVEGDFLYVLGDNPRFSIDSRQYGYVRRDSVVGTVVLPRQRAGELSTTQQKPI